MRITFTVICIGILCFASVAFSGCAGKDQHTNPATFQPTPIGTPVCVGHHVFNEFLNNATVYLNRTDSITLSLAENPTTGYLRNLTTTSGLKVTKDTFVPSPTSGTVFGSGGNHIWEMIATGAGEQKIVGMYKQPWEPVFGNEKTFSMTVVVR